MLYYGLGHTVYTAYTYTVDYDLDLTANNSRKRVVLLVSRAGQGADHR